MYQRVYKDVKGDVNTLEKLHINNITNRISH